MGKKVVAIVQARMGSKRLLGKMMMEIKGKPLVFYLLHQLKFSKQIEKVVLATSTLAENDSLAEYARRMGIEVFRGSEDDVLGRYLEAARKFKADIIVRITGDEPLIDPQITDDVIKDHLKKKADYTSTKLERIMSKGVDSEVFSIEVLEKVGRLAKSDYDREHVTPYIYNHPELFKINAYKPSNPKKIYPLEQRPVVTVDDANDFNLVKGIIEELFNEKKPILLGDVIKLINKL
ncbi:glycosyltransferase family protein [Candidatus Woesearchaeota archaeon]|nr:glycosyltransferase family protein [Candidatus Woesearchaeota archaeon]